MKDVFITENFLLQNETAVRLYHDYAKDLPIIDYHCHISPQQIAEDHRFRSLAQIWLAGDHYKWRLLRANGVPERLITGDASDWEKFRAWAETVPKTLRNPIYQWTHMELKRPFGISDRLLGPDTAKGIWDECNAKLAMPEFSARGIMRQMNVVLVCTTDDAADPLEPHADLAEEETFPIQVLPAFRPDRCMAVESAAAFNEYVDRLAAETHIAITSFAHFLDAIRNRHDVFHRMGCRLSDHGIETFYAADYTHAELQAIFHKVRGGAELAPPEILKFKSALLHEFAVMDWEKGWTQQFHVGVIRNANTRLFQALGRDVGCDSIGDFEIARPLALFLDRLDQQGKLAKTILYNLNPRDNELLATMIGNFQDGSIPGKLQFGGAWWFNDQKDGIEKQMETLSNCGLLSRFVGMLTDSRSFLSYTRHEYFRRILCNVLGTEMEMGLLPGDLALVGSMVQDICYNNARSYFGFDGLPAPKAATKRERREH